MKYYRLLDDISIPTRWHLGEIVDRGSGSHLELWRGVPVRTGIIAQAEIAHFGDPLEFCLTTFGVPVAHEGLVRAIAQIAGEDLQVLPVDIPENAGFNLLNSIRIVRCLDENRSEFIKWTKADHRGDLAGQYRMVTRLMIDPARVPQNAHFFRIEGWLIALIISEKIKSVMEKHGCFGAKFLAVS